MSEHRHVPAGEDLNTLPGGTVLLTADGTVYQRDLDHDFWQGIADTDPLTAADIAEVLGERGATILWEGPA